MFLNGISKKYNVDILSTDVSLHSGIPKYLYNMKDKEFNDWEIPPWELFIFKDQILGEGSFSKVYLAKWRETFVVAKVIDHQFYKIKKDIVMREIDIMSKIHHPNIVQFLGYIDDPFTIILEYIPSGDLNSNIKKLNKKQKLSIMRDILKGLAYIHNRRPNNLIHRDIKPTNILLTNSKVAKIADFGLSKFYNLNKINSFENVSDLDTDKSKQPLLINDNTIPVGTERYMAPEVKNNSTYDNKIDIYSCGILFYELFEGKKYIPNMEMKWCYTPKIIRNIITTKMCSEEPNYRLDALSIIKLLNNYNI